MPLRVKVPEVTIRTTSDSEGHPHGIVTGMGLSPELALTALKQQAQTQAENVAALHYQSVTHPPSATASRLPRASDRSGGQPEFPTGEPSGRPGSALDRFGRGARMAQEIPGGSPESDYSVEWWFEVVDVRLAPALMKGGESGWLAYGTLLTKGEQPLVVSGPPWRSRE